MAGGRKPKSVSGRDELSVALDQIKQGFEMLVSAVRKNQGAAVQTGRAPGRPPRAGKATDKPAEGEPAYEMYAILAKSKRPVKPEVLAKKTGKSLGSIRLYLSKYSCFENVRGKGYRVK